MAGEGRFSGGVVQRDCKEVARIIIRRGNQRFQTPAETGFAVLGRSTR